MSFPSNFTSASYENNYYNVNFTEFKPANKKDRTPLPILKNKENINPNISSNNAYSIALANSQFSNNLSNSKSQKDDNSRPIFYQNPNSYSRNFSQKESNAIYILNQKNSLYSERKTSAKVGIIANESINNRMNESTSLSKDPEYTKWNVNRNISRKNILIDSNHLDNVSEIMKILEALVHVNCIYDIHDAIHIPCKRQAKNNKVVMIGNLEIGFDKNNRPNHAFFVPIEKIKKFDSNLIIDEVNKNKLHNCIFNFDSLVNSKKYATTEIADNDGIMTFLLKI